MNTLRNKLGAALAVLVMSAPVATLAQPAPASVHGHAQNPAAMAITSGSVKLTQDRSSDEKNRKYLYTFPVDGTGNYKGTGITPGTYVLMLVNSAGNTLDYLDNVVFAPGADKQVDVDMTRKEFMDKMTPEEKKNLEDFKKKNAEAVAANAKIANLNATLTNARTLMAAKNYDEAAKAMKEATDGKPDEPVLWLEYGNALLGQADAAAAAAKAAGKAAATDPDVQAKYTASADAFGKVKELYAAPGKKANADVAGSALEKQGTAYAKAGKTTEAQASFDAAAVADPTKAKTYYFNEAATFYNANNLDPASAAADKSIAADPANAMAYYIKAQALIPKATVDPKTNKITAPPGTVEAYQKYLEIEPNGPHAEEVKGILTGIGAEVKSTFKAAPAKKK